MSSKQVKRVFQWFSLEDGKKEYDEFESVFQEQLGEVSYVREPRFVALAIPAMPDPLPAAANASAKDKWDKKKRAHEEGTLKVVKDCLKAISEIRSLFPHATTARSQVEGAIKVRPANISEEDWTPITQLPLMLAKLRSEYAPTGITDTTIMRTNLQHLTDQCPGGFSEYRTKFNLGHNQLIMAGGENVVTEGELREWVKGGIQNPEVLNHLASFYIENEDATFAEIFTRVDKFITLLHSQGKDPYKSVASVSGRASVSANAASVARGGQRRVTSYGGARSDNCTRCWNSGHGWKVCSASKCGACGQGLETDAKTCPKWRDHASAKHRFLLNYEPWNRPNSSSVNGTIRHNKRPADPTPIAGEPPVKTPATEELKSTRKAFRKALAAVAKEKAVTG